MEILDKDKFYSWFNNVKWTGDPYDDTEKLVEIDRIDPNKIIKRDIYLNYNTSNTQESNSESSNNSQDESENSGYSSSTGYNFSSDDNIENELKGKEKYIEGYWVKHKNKWIYVTRVSKKVYLYDNNLKYQKELKNLKATISQNRIYFHDKNEEIGKDDKSVTCGYGYHYVYGKGCVKNSSSYNNPTDDISPEDIDSKQCPEGTTLDLISGFCL